MFKTIETNCKLYTAKYTKKPNGMTKHPSPVLSTMQLGVTMVKIEVRILPCFPSNSTNSSLWTYPNSLCIAPTLSGTELDNNLQILHENCCDSFCTRREVTFFQTSISVSQGYQPSLSANTTVADAAAQHFRRTS